MGHSPSDCVPLLRNLNLSDSVYSSLLPDGADKQRLNQAEGCADTSERSSSHSHLFRPGCIEVKLLNGWVRQPEVKRVVVGWVFLT